ncbi:MAG: TauD/TfdA family dioxygenase [Proteobacteria bacterium]|nr:TauD/TfdA family dioxygenase [Pseudomonadota bacterium]
MSPLAGAATIFSLGNEHAYRRWRDAKLAAYPRAPNALTVEVEDLAAPTRAETRAVLAACRRANLCLYRARAHRGDARATRRALGAFARHFGLTRFEAQRSAAADGIVALEIAAQGGRHGYIPYTNRPIGWHTDGYYNYAGPRQMIRAMLLHCVRSASLGGDNGLIDHEIAYIRLRDENPDYVAALMHPQAMSVPASEAADGKPRAENTGPVFVVDPDTGALGMRYTARKRNIGWHADAVAAAAALERLLADEALALRVKLAPGDGVICNNVLHDRIGFEADSDRGGGRLIYRVRSYDRVGDACGAPRADEGA